MSIANLTNSDFPIMINSILTTNIDTPIDENLNIGTTGTSGITIGNPSVDVMIPGILLTGNIDTPVSENLNIGLTGASGINIGSTGINIDINGNLLTDFIDTPIHEVLNIGTTGASGIIMGKVGSTIKFPSTILTTNIDANTDTSTTLFIAPNLATNVEVGMSGGNPITCPSGVLATSLNMGGSIGAGTLQIGNLSSTTAINIGQNLSASSFIGTLNFPSLGVPYSITDSRPASSNLVAFNGALNMANAAKVSLYRLGNWVTVTVRNLLPPTNALDSINPIIMPGAIPLEYRPANPYIFLVLCWDSGLSNNGQCNILTNGDITVGKVDTNHFSSGNACGIEDFSFSYNMLD